MICEANMPKEFWNEAVRVAAYILNRSPISERDKTASEIWHQKRPNVSNIKVFGCVAFIHIPNELRSKMDDKAEKCVLVVYTNTGYRLWNIEKKKIVVSRNVVFNEKKYYFKPKSVMIDLSEEKKRRRK